MNELLSHIFATINKPLNTIFSRLFAFIPYVPGWLSITLISAVTGMILLVLFKCTSNQKAIAKTRDSIKANTLALKLYKDSFVVTMQCQSRILAGVFLLFFHSLRPMVVMIIPVMLLLAQMGLWYQSRPLEPGEDAIVFMKLHEQADISRLQPSIKSVSGAEIIIEAVKVIEKNEVHWKIRAQEPGYHEIVFQVADEIVEKELAIGSGFMRVSVKRPNEKWFDIITHPAEMPLNTDSPIESITIEYPDRVSKIYGTDWWVVYFFISSMIFALIVRPVLKVRI